MKAPGRGGAGGSQAGGQRWIDPVRHIPLLPEGEIEAPWRVRPAVAPPPSQLSLTPFPFPIRGPSAVPAQDLGLEGL